MVAAVGKRLVVPEASWICNKMQKNMGKRLICPQLCGQTEPFFFAKIQIKKEETNN